MADEGVGKRLIVITISAILFIILLIWVTRTLMTMYG